MTTHNIDAKQVSHKICQFCAEGITCDHGLCNLCQVCRDCARELTALAKSRYNHWQMDMERRASEAAPEPPSDPPIPTAWERIRTALLSLVFGTAFIASMAWQLYGLLLLWMWIKDFVLHATGW